MVGPGWIPHAVKSPYLYLFLGCWGLGLGVFQVGIQRCRVGVVASLNSVVASAFVVATGLVIFGEHLPADPTLRLLRLVGFAGILIGSGLVGWETLTQAFRQLLLFPLGRLDDASRLFANRRAYRPHARREIDMKVYAGCDPF